MSGVDDLAGMIVPTDTPRFDTGTVVQLVDDGHVSVDLGERVATATLPQNLAGTVQVGSFIRVSIQQNTMVVDCVISGMVPLIPVGLVAWFGKASPPPGWLVCEGQSFSAATYPDLYAYLGGTTMPDYRGQVLVGQKSGLFGTLGASVGAETVTLTEAQMPAHSHLYGTNNTGSLASTGTNPVHGTAFNTTDYETDFSGGNAAHPNVQPSRVGKWLMSAGRVIA